MYSTMDIFADNELPQNKLYNPSLAGPPMTATYQQPTSHVSPNLGMSRTSSVPVNMSGGSTGPVSSSFRSAAPPVTPLVPSSLPPVTPMAPPHAPPISRLHLLNMSSMPQSGAAVGPPKPGMNYPRPVSLAHQTPAMGMDPTAPITSDKPIGPPPTLGFTR